jgi:hypothetical protein
VKVSSGSESSLPESRSDEPDEFKLEKPWNTPLISTLTFSRVTGFGLPAIFSTAPVDTLTSIPNDHERRSAYEAVRAPLEKALTEGRIGLHLWVAFSADVVGDGLALVVSDVLGVALKEVLVVELGEQLGVT